MAILGKWTGLNISEFPSSTSFVDVPGTVYPTQVRNDGSAYTKTGSAITLDTSNDADGYIIRASVEIATTHNNRFTAQIKVVPTTGAANATVLDAIAGQFSRNNADNDSSSDCFTVVTGITGPITLQTQWRRQGTQSPAGSVSNSCLEIVPIYFNGIGLYEGTTNQLLGGITPNTITIDNTILETGSISRTGSAIQLGANKKYLCLACYYREGGSSGRTQRWVGFGEDGTLLRDAMTNIYYRDTNNFNQGEVVSTIISTGGTPINLSMLGYRGDGTSPPSLGGADIDSGPPTTTLLSVAVIELKSGCEVFRSVDTTGEQNVGADTDVQINAARTNIFASAGSFAQSGITGYEAIVAMDGYFGGNVSASYDLVSGTRLTRRVLLTKNNIGDINANTVKYGRGNQGGQSTFGFSGNPWGMVTLAPGETIGVGVQDIANQVAVRTRPGWVGLWGINLDTMNNDTPPPTPTRRFFSIT